MSATSFVSLSGLFLGVALAALPMVVQANEGPLRGVEAVEGEPIYYQEARRNVGTVPNYRPDEPVELRLSKCLYPAADRHVDGVVWFDADQSDVEGVLEVELLDARGNHLSRATMETIPGPVTFFSYDFPERLAGDEGRLIVVWKVGGREVGRAERSFEVAEPSEVARSGEIALVIPNETGAVGEAIPMTVGVPFPQGALADSAKVRLLDEAGDPIPFQTRITGRWSRFGFIKWLRCDFAVDLEGEPRQLRLEYGKQAAPPLDGPLQVEVEEGFPNVSSGRLRVDDEGVWFRFGEGEFRKMLSGDALRGAFVEHEDGRRFFMGASAEFEVEHAGPEAAVIKSEGYYKSDDGEPFCWYVIRYYLFRDSPFVRIFHTWIFTGDGNRDRVFDMGWRFAYPDADSEPLGFLVGNGGDAEWLPGERLLQFEHEQFEVVQANATEVVDGERAPGVFGFHGTGAVVVGARDFWQNYPSELSFDAEGITFHNWPRRGRADQRAAEWDSFPGLTGGGWAGPWEFEGVSVEHFELTDEGESERLLAMNVPAGIRSGGLARRFLTSDDLDLARPHAVEFTVRIDDLAAFHASPETWIRMASSDAPHGINARNQRWWVGARSGMDDGNWQVRDGGGLSDGSRVRGVNTGIPVEEGVAYRFRFELDPAEGGYRLILSDDKGRSFESGHLGFRADDLEGAATLSFNVQKADQPEVIDQSLVIQVGDFQIFDEEGDPIAEARFVDGLSADFAPILPVHLRFAHTGEVLDFRLPSEFSEDPIYQAMSANRPGEMHWVRSRPDTANAQGIARTEEYWIHLLEEPPAAERTAALMEGLNDQTVRAVVDPVWVAASGAMGMIHPYDPERYPEEERIFELVAHAPAIWNDRIGLYGMWAFGDTMWGPNLRDRTAVLYRAFRKSHHGWPYSWIPFARSGNPDFLRYADAATRQMTDANYSHYFTEEVNEMAGENRFRAKGWWYRSLVPWAGRHGPVTRAYQVQCDFLWDAYFLTGYERARDVALDWAAEVKVEQPLDQRGRVGPPARASVTLLKSTLDMFQATFDPWFLIAAQELARMHQKEWAVEERAEWHDPSTLASRAGHFWDTADRDYLEFTGCPEHKEHYLHYAHSWAQPRNFAYGWPSHGAPLIEPAGHGYRITGDERFLQRLRHFVDYASNTVWDEEHPYLQGTIMRDSSSTTPPLWTSWYLKQFPYALAVFEEAGGMPEVTLPSPFFQSGVGTAVKEEDGQRLNLHEPPVVAVYKEAGEEVSLLLDVVGIQRRAREGETWNYQVTGPDGEVVLEGEWLARQEGEVVVPPDAPEGVYRLRTWSWSPISHGGRGLLIPVTTPGHPEVLELAPGEPMGQGRFESQYWFLVPEEVREFTIRIPVEPPHLMGRRMSLWAPDGERVWDLQIETPLYQGPNPIEVRIEVEPDQAGKLWRLTLPGRNFGFEMDDQIPPYYSVSPERWLNPAE